MPITMEQMTFYYLLVNLAQSDACYFAHSSLPNQATNPTTHKFVFLETCRTSGFLLVANVPDPFSNGSDDKSSRVKLGVIHMIHCVVADSLTREHLPMQHIII